MAKALWSSSTTNVKTGPIPTMWVGNSIEDAWESCDGCPRRPPEPGKAQGMVEVCYAWVGPVYSLGFKSKVLPKHMADPSYHEVERALQNRRVDARAVRLGAIGDPARVDRTELLHDLALVRAAGLAVLGYTHFPEENPDLAGVLLASLDDPKDPKIPLLIELGWRVAVVLPPDYQGKRFSAQGLRGFVCPAQTLRPRKAKEKNKKEIPGTTCNQCRLCDRQHVCWDKVDMVGFLRHSRPEALRAYWRGRNANQLSIFNGNPDL